MAVVLGITPAGKKEWLLSAMLSIAVRYESTKEWSEQSVPARKGVAG
jgi:hypothetical protein